MQYFKSLEDVLVAKKPTDKFKKFEVFYKEYLNNECEFEADYVPVKLTEPSYFTFMNIVLPNKIKMRKHFDTVEGKALLLHAIAHIEYSAIDLALDAALRFKDKPKQYYDDWLEVAEDEIRHFQMIEKILNELGYKYGDFDVHTNLFEAMQKTQDFLKRMAIVPRYLEANGLDQNPKIMERLRSTKSDEISLKILDALNIILEEEIDHVTKGDRWFKYACEQACVEPEQTYRDLIDEFYPGVNERVKEDMNFEARKKAGFSCDELKILSNKRECE